MSGYRGETYYGRPALKPPHYGWLVVAYLFTGGIAGAAQVIAAAAGGRRAGRVARAIALAGVAASPALLIADLHHRSRWYNMLRIARPSSPMSLGSWTLGALGGLSALGVLADLARSAPLRRAVAPPAAVAGAVLSVYTGSLFASTATPLWSSVPRWLPVLFGASAMSTASAALELAGEDLGPLPAVALGSELVAMAATTRAWHDAGVAGAIDDDPALVLADRLSVGLGIVALAAHLLGRRRTGAVAALAAGVTLRALIVFGGRRSGARPRDYFGQGVPDDVPTAAPAARP